MSIIRIKRTDTSTTPTGLTFGEMAYVQGIKSLYMGQTAGDPALRIGAEVDSSASLGTSNNKIPTQGAVKAYIDSAVGGGAVGTVNGLTGAVVIAPGTAIGISTAGQNITVTNTGVQSFNGSTGAVTGVSSAVAGTGIAVSSSTGAVTFTNTGVQSLAGTSNQITVSGSTGAVTLSLPSTVTVPGALNVTTNLTVTGNLTINGTTTTVNSDVMTVDDPIITLGLSGGAPLTVSDGGKDRGIAFSYFNVTGKTGFFGYDASSGYFTIIPEATITNDVVSGSVGNANFNLLSLDSYLYLNNGGSYHRFNSTASGIRTIIAPDHSGTLVIPSDLGISSYILKSNGDPDQPTWIDSNAAGFTAFTSTNVLTASDTSDTSAVIAFVPAASATNQGIKYNAGLTYNAVTNSVSATTFVGALSGNATTATTATNATNVRTTVDTTDVQAFLAFVPLASDVNQGVRYNSGLTYNAVSNSLTATTFVGALSGNATTASTLQTARNIGLTGDVSGSASFNGSADINITATIAANSVALGTDTTGNYVATLTTSETGLTIGNSGTENAAVTINFATITSGLDMGPFNFATGEFVNTSGTISLGTVDGGTY